MEKQSALTAERRASARVQPHESAIRLSTRRMLTALAVICLGVFGAGRAVPSPQQEIVQGTAGYLQDGEPVADREFFRFSDTGDLSHQVERGVIRVLVSMEKTSFAFHNNKPIGFEFALMERYRDYLRTQVDPQDWPVQFVFVPLPSDALIPTLLDGYGDIVAAGLTVTPERQEQVAFTAPYLGDVEEVVVTAPSVEGIATPDDLAGREIFIRQGTGYAESLSALNADLVRRGLAPVTTKVADPVLASEDILSLVNEGLVDMTVTYGHLARLWSAVYPDMIVRDDLVLRAEADIAWVVRKENTELLDSLNEFLKENRQGTLVGNVLINRYLMGPGWFADPLEEEAQARYDKLFSLFQRYGEMYDVEPSLLAAIAFQESRLDNDVRSPVGAVGVMQIMPSTAAAPPLELSPIEDVEVNVHAGARYFSYIRDNVFNEPGLRPDTRINFTLGSYNAGRTRIQRLRGEAEEEGLDPDRWFGNVERIVRRQVGLEPVEYVGNIRRFHLKYQLMDEARAARAQARERASQ